jgi:superoxide dismutase, Cu-Zn family
MRPYAVLIGGIACLAASSIAGPAGAQEGSGGAEAPDPVARATIRACATGQPLGTAVLREEPSDEGVKEVDVRVRVTRRNTVLTEGKHGVHIHEVGDCSQACAAALGHFDPGPNGNPSPDGNHPFHLGDLINIKIAGDGRGSLRTTTSRVTLSPGPLSVFDANGSAVIIHTGVDTYCPHGPVTGCAGGARAACGVVKRGR